jgi:hypothetical protein
MRGSPLRVISGHREVSLQCPLYPQSGHQSHAPPCLLWARTGSRPGFPTPRFSSSVIAIDFNYWAISTLINAKSMRHWRRDHQILRRGLPWRRHGAKADNRRTIVSGCAISEIESDPNDNRHCGVYKRSEAARLRASANANYRQKKTSWEIAEGLRLPLYELSNFARGNWGVPRGMAHELDRRNNSGWLTGSTRRHCDVCDVSEAA